MKVPVGCAETRRKKQHYSLHSHAPLFSGCINVLSKVALIQRTASNIWFVL